MAQPTVLPGTKLIILVGDDASPESFSEPCGLTTKSFTLNATTNSTLLPDCADPEAPAWEAKDVNSLSAEVSGSGVMAVESFMTWWNWFNSADLRTCKIELNDSALGYWLGEFIITKLAYGGERGKKVTLDITLVNSGALTFVEL